MVYKHRKQTETKKLLYFTSKIFIMKMDEKRCLLFDVTMGAYNGVEVCELVGTFSLLSVDIMTTGCQYLKTQLKRIKKSLQKHSRNLV